MTGLPNIGFQSKIFVNGNITALTGLHIGGNSTEMSIGGADSIVVRDPLTNYPYIPGSSLRGKMRSLLERTRGEMTIELEGGNNSETVHGVEALAKAYSEAKGKLKLKSAKPATDYKARASQLFGISVDQQSGARPEEIVPQRLVVRDARLVNVKELENAKNTDMPFTEVKTEVVIDRITSAAVPRQIERVPAGAVFDLQLILNLYGQDESSVYLGLLFKCMELLQDDYLGGNGSRGYGRVMFDVESVTQRTAKNYRENQPAQAFKCEIPSSLINRTQAP